MGDRVAWLKLALAVTWMRIGVWDLLRSPEGSSEPQPVAPPALLARHAGKLDFQRHSEPASAACGSLDNVEGSRVALPSWFPQLCLGTGVCHAALLPELSITPGKFSWAVFAAGPASVLR